MKRFIVILLTVILSGCGSTQSSDDSVHPAYTVEKDLGLYVGYQKARLVMDDGRLHDPVYNLVTSVVQEGVYLAYQPDPLYNTSYRVVMRRQYRDGKPIDQRCVVYIGIGNDLSSYGYFNGYVPGDLYY